MDFLFPLFSALTLAFLVSLLNVWFRFLVDWGAGVVQQDINIFVSLRFCLFLFWFLFLVISARIWKLGWCIDQPLRFSWRAITCLYAAHSQPWISRQWIILRFLLMLCNCMAAFPCAGWLGRPQHSTNTDEPFLITRFWGEGFGKIYIDPMALCNWRKLVPN